MGDDGGTTDWRVVLCYVEHHFLFRVVGVSRFPAGNAAFLPRIQGKQSQPLLLLAPILSIFTPLTDWWRR